MSDGCELGAGRGSCERKLGAGIWELGEGAVRGSSELGGGAGSWEREL